MEVDKVIPLVLLLFNTFRGNKEYSLVLDGLSWGYIFGMWCYNILVLKKCQAGRFRSDSWQSIMKYEIIYLVWIFDFFFSDYYLKLKIFPHTKQTSTKIESTFLWALYIWFFILGFCKNSSYWFGLFVYFVFAFRKHADARIQKKILCLVLSSKILRKFNSKGLNQFSHVGACCIAVKPIFH